MNNLNSSINIKKGRSLMYPFDDPNYVPRIISSKRIKIRNNEKIEVDSRIKHSFPINSLDSVVLSKMKALSYQTGGIAQKMFKTNPNNISSRKNPRIVNNSPKFINRRKRNNLGQVERIQVRAIPIKRYTKEFVHLITEGTDPRTLMNSDKKISKRYIKTVLRTTKQNIDKTYGFNKSKKQ